MMLTGQNVDSLLSLWETYEFAFRPKIFADVRSRFHETDESSKLDSLNPDAIL